MLDWITTSELSKIIGISARAIRKSIVNKKYVVQKFGKRYEIFISSLPDDMQREVKTYFENKNDLALKNIQYSEEAKKLALTKFDTVMRWRKFRKTYRGTKVDSVKEFVALNKISTQSGNVYSKIENVSSCTMLRWDKKLRENNDNWQALLCRYVAHAHKKGLSKLEQETFLKFLLHPNKTSVGKAIKLTKFMLTEQGNTNLACDMTYRRFAKKYMEEHYDLWVFSREGSKALRDRVIPYIKRDVSKLNVGDVIVGYGHRLAFQVINPFDGKPCRPTLVAYQDWKSSALIGFEIMIEENTQCIASAFRNAVINLGKLPKYVYQDNGKAFKSKYFTDSENCIEGLFTRLGVTPIYALPYNAKAKVIERFFREMQDSFERLLPSFVGSCINDKPAYTKRNE